MAGKIWTWDGQDVTPAPRYRMIRGARAEAMYIDEPINDPRREPIQFTVTEPDGDWTFNEVDPDPYLLQTTQTTVWRPNWGVNDPIWQKARIWWENMGQYEDGLKLSQFKFTDWKEVWR